MTPQERNALLVEKRKKQFKIDEEKNAKRQKHEEAVRDTLKVKERLAKRMDVPKKETIFTGKDSDAEADAYRKAKRAEAARKRRAKKKQIELEGEEY